MGSSELKVLVVDDDFRVANMHAGIVNALPGFSVTTTATTLAAARKADEDEAEKKDGPPQPVRTTKGIQLWEHHHRAVPAGIEKSPCFGERGRNPARGRQISRIILPTQPISGYLTPRAVTSVSRKGSPAAGLRP